ncbi:DHHW family protein [Clostridium cylindrosporum]|uniref:AlgX/AlgJ SGNH hydrolase-like domain-containing protein n=1 Tax=Clostridium cylindrosporum DSM 605 TaxID=1121307 RepID=A0A0J8DFA9_CLOCY|nr:DHHW family protein [Clostridium cylindrosporum]KMT22863.1 hypothetical protein CLCY_5c01020 [Clostridium cylindrosporum DSM 605]
MIKDIKLAILTVVFILIIFPLGIYNLFKGDRVYSDIENRNLMKKPKVSIKGIWNGKYFQDYEEYTKDQFAFKDSIVSSYVKFNFYALGRDKVNGFYLGNGGRLYEDRDIDVENSIELVKKRNDYIKKLSDEIKSMGKDFYFLYAPYSSDYDIDPLPLYAKANMKKVLEVESVINSLSNSVDYINMRDIFDKKAEGLPDKADKFYFKTDHHWNIDGAYMAYEYIVNKAREKFKDVPEPLRPNEEFMVDTYYKFNGSYNRKLQFNIDSNDEIKVYRPRKDLMKERITDYGPGSDPIDKDLLESKSSYSVFMGGDKARDMIKTNRKELPNILVIGNSFTNAAETLLYTNFNQMHSIDVRDDNQGAYDIAHYAKRNNIDIVVFIRGGI